VNTTEVQKIADILIEELDIERPVEILLTEMGFYEDGCHSFDSKSNKHFILLSNHLFKWWSWTSVAEVLAHEMVHAKQTETQVLRYCDGQVYWNDKPYKDTWILGYWRRPWEVEARRNEKTLAKIVRNRLKEMV